MRNGTDKMARNRAGICAAITFALLSTQAFAVARPSNVEAALNSAVRIEVSLRFPDNPKTAEFSGSGWTRECKPVAGGYMLVVATAGHVVDVAGLEEEVRPQKHADSIVKVVVIYRDGTQLLAGREDIRVDRVHDYGEIRVRSPLSRPVLPAGLAAATSEGAFLFTVASPGLLAYAYFDGSLTSRDASIVGNAPRGAWLTSIAVAPGASGAPVLDENGAVVAFVDGLVMWPWGSQASVVVALPDMIPAVQQTAMESEDGSNFFERLQHIVALGSAAGVAWAVGQALLPLLRRPRFSQAALDIVLAVCQTVVSATEQAHGQQAGADKKQIAQEAIGGILSRLNLHPPKALVDAAIEAAVHVMNSLRTKKDEQPTGGPR